jgi:hypothetical protein
MVDGRDDAKAEFDADGAWRLDAASVLRDLEHLSSKAQLELLGRLADQVEAMVALHWPAIERVAEPLLCHGYLSGKKIDAVIAGRPELVLPTPPLSAWISAARQLLADGTSWAPEPEADDDAPSA